MTEIAAKGRGRISPAREAELYEAVLSLLREVGYDALTVEAVAARTRFSKATLYRHWGGKAELVVQALRSGTPFHIDAIDTGSLRGDLHALVTAPGSHPLQRNSDLLRGVAIALQHHPDLRQVLREKRAAIETATIRCLLERAVERGEIRPGNPALPYAVHVMLGALISHGLLIEQPPSQAFLASYIDSVVLPALGAPSAGAPAGRDASTPTVGPATSL
ncbi:TetR/AcrR family transcriptional regulator [Streptomyces sp. NPDC002156]